MSESRKGEKNPFFGIHHLEETITYLKETWDQSHGHLRGKPHPTSPKIKCIQTGIVYDSIQICAQAHNVSAHGIRRLLKKGRLGQKQNMKGLSFQLIRDK